MWRLRSAELELGGSQERPSGVIIGVRDRVDHHGVERRHGDRSPWGWVIERPCRGARCRRQMTKILTRLGGTCSTSSSKFRHLKSHPADPPNLGENYLKNYLSELVRVSVDGGLRFWWSVIGRGLRSRSLRVCGAIRTIGCASGDQLGARGGKRPPEAGRRSENARSARAVRAEGVGRMQVWLRCAATTVEPPDGCS